MAGKDPPSFTEMEWLILLTVDVGAHMRRFSGFNSLDTLQPLRN